MTRWRRAGIGLALVAGYACGQGEAAEAPGAEPQEVVVHTFDYAFDAPDTIEAGPTTVRLVNGGPDFHHVWLVRLEQGHTVAELKARLAQARPLPSWAVAVGGPNTPGAPGGETVATVDLQPGSYALVCVIPGMHDGEYHVMKGMIDSLTVVPTRRRARMPEPDLVMTLEDYRFDLDRPLRAGRRTIRVVNEAAQPHEVVVVKLEPGRSAEDFLAFLQRREGAPPGRIVGGVTYLGRGESNLVSLDFAPGEYALLCFVPDEGDGRPHIAHGMIQHLAVE